MTVDEWRRPDSRPSNTAVAELDWPPLGYRDGYRAPDHGYADFPGLAELDQELDSSLFSPEPSITEQDVYASLGPEISGGNPGMSSLKVVIRDSTSGGELR